MKRQRLVALLFAVACLFLAGTVLRQFHVPVVRSAAAQDAQPPPPASPMFQGGFVPASPAMRKAASACIIGQLQAFAKDDYHKAEQYQSQGMKVNFGSVASFRQVITGGYPEFAHYKSIRFGRARSDADGRHLLLQVTLTGQDGVTVQAMYMMVKEGKAYHVAGVAGGNRPPQPTVPDGSADA